MGGLTGSRFLEGVAGKEGVNFFWGGGGERCSFCIKNKLKSEINKIKNVSLWHFN